MTATIINDDREWQQYIIGLDLAGCYYHKHHGAPQHYPCKPESEFWDDPNGPYTYTHTFTYQTRVVCPCCGASQMVWPDDGPPAKEPTP